MHLHSACDVFNVLAEKEMKVLILHKQKTHDKNVYYFIEKNFMLTHNELMILPIFQVVQVLLIKSLFQLNFNPFYFQSIYIIYNYSTVLMDPV